MRIALAQILSTTDPEVNLGLVADSVEAAEKAGARLVVFPEATMCRFGVKLSPIAEPLDGPWASAVRELAARRKVTVVAGMFTPAEDGRVHNTLLATGPGVEAHYRKIHLFDAFGFAESDTVAPGARIVRIEVDGVIVGLTTCYDLRFPGLYQELAQGGASVVLAPASWGAGRTKREQWELLVRARALDSTAYVAACDQADPTTVGQRRGRAPTGIGFSMLAGPTGEIVDQLGAAPGLLVADVEPDEVAKARELLPVLANRRV